MLTSQIFEFFTWRFVSQTFWVIFIQCELSFGVTEGICNYAPLLQLHILVKRQVYENKELFARNKSRFLVFLSIFRKCNKMNEEFLVSEYHSVSNLITFVIPLLQAAINEKFRLKFSIFEKIPIFEKFRYSKNSNFRKVPIF